MHSPGRQVSIDERSHLGADEAASLQVRVPNPIIS